MTKDEKRREAGQAAWRASAGSTDTYRVDRVIDAVKEANPWVGVIEVVAFFALVAFVSWLVMR
jgi:hypothetical protein